MNLKEVLEDAIEEQIRQRVKKLNLKFERRQIRDAWNRFDLKDTSFKKQFRLNKVSTQLLLNELRDHMPRSIRNTAVPFELKVLSALCSFGHGSYQNCIGQHFNLELSQQCVSEAINEVTEAISTHLVHRWMTFPQTNNAVNEKKIEFMDKFNVLGVCGLIDCMHVAIVAPPAENNVRTRILYYNRKGFYSINVQVICDSRLRIMNVNARFPGTRHDSFIWSLSPVRDFLKRKFEQQQFVHTWLLGDSGYPMEPWLLVPILGAALGTPEERYNSRHILTRNCVERYFGVLKQRFRCLLKHRTLHYNPVKAAKIIYSWCVLHNMITDPEDVEDLENIPDEDEMQDSLPQGDILDAGRVQRN